MTVATPGEGDEEPAGLDVGAVISGLHQPLPLVRFQLLVQKAAELCQEVRALGNALLTAMEKEEGEALTILRARHAAGRADLSRRRSAPQGSP